MTSPGSEKSSPARSLEIESQLARCQEQLQQAQAQLQVEREQRQQLEVARRNLLHRLVTSQEDERLRISRELHDQLGQNLVALMMGLKALPDLLDGQSALEPKVIEQLHKLQGLTAILMEQVHHLAWQLRPAALDNVGLEAALAQFVSEWSRSSGIEAEFLSNGLAALSHDSQSKSAGATRLPPHLETAFYRAVQEALLNVQKHAGAQRVAVLLEKRGREIVAIIEDDGTGFDAEAALEKTHRLGLCGMSERLKQIGGSAEIESAPGQGTTVFLRAPLERRCAPRD